ncbi:MAG: hypothetical protein H7Y12_00520 [Sphingobacteriaceae bacterium]|nr:hypothetical protein [Cytophagaceae bacterium]
MNLDELKTAWHSLDEKVMTTQKLGENLALSMMKERSRSTLATMQTELKRVGAYLVLLLVVFGAVLLGNPFDFTHGLEYVPAVLYLGLLGIALRNVWREHRQLRAISLTKSNLRESLRAVIQSHETYRFAMSWVWKVSLGAGFLFGVSLTARNFAAYGLTKFLLLLGGQLILIATLYALARWLFGQFPDAQTTALKAHLEELEELD